MKDCEDCKYFNGYDYCDGTPRCSIDGGYEQCPYCDETDTELKGINLSIDVKFMEDYIKHTIQNTISREAHTMIESRVKTIIENSIKDIVEGFTKEAVSKYIDNEIQEYMQNDMTVGGGWSEPSRTVKREQYIGELIEEEFDKKIKDKSGLISIISKDAEKRINNFSKNIRDEVDGKIINCFNEAMRQNLTDNIVKLLMSNETYQTLSNNIKQLAN